MKHPLTILLIDDDLNLRLTLGDILKIKGYHILLAGSGEEALRLATNDEIVVALIDLRLGDMPGLQVLRALKGIKPDTACILLTGHASQDSAIEAINAGAYSYLLKPVNVDQLLLTIQRAIEKRQIDQALLESEKHYQALAEVSPVGIFRTDIHGHTTYVNPYWSVLSGRPPGDALGLGWLDGIHPGDRARVAGGWNTVLMDQQVSVTEYRFLRPDGSVAWVIGQAIPEFNSYGEFVGYVGTITDITERKKVEDALYRSEAQYRLITDHIHDIVWQLDQQLRFIYVSPAVEVILGYTPEEACQLNVWDVLDEAGIALMQGIVQISLATAGQAAPPRQPSQYRMRCKSGDWLPVEVVSSPVYNAEKQWMGFVGVTRDISERKRAESQLRLQSSALEVVANAIVITDQDGKMEWVNPAFTQLTGYTLDEAVGQNPRILKSGVQSLAVYQHLWETIQAKQVWRGELVNRRKDGSHYIEDITITPLENEAGQITHFIAIKQDITARKRTEADLQRHLSDLEMLYENGLKLARLIDTKEIAQCVIELIAQRMNWHHAVLRLVNEKKEWMDVVGFSHIGLGPADIESERQRLQGIPLRHGQGVTGWVLEHGETVRLGNLGSDPRWAETYPGMQSGLYVPIFGGGRVIGVISVESEKPEAFTHADERLLVTLSAQAAAAIENARLHQELEQRVEERTAELRVTNAALEKASRSKDEFLASMSHELRTPLTGILNLSEVLQEQHYGALNERQLRYVRTIEESGRHLLGLINDILDISKIEAGQFELQRDTFPVDQVCQSSLQLTRGLASKKNQQVSYSISPPDMMLFADMRRVKQMLVNLLSNAVKFTPAGGKIGLEAVGDEAAKVIRFTVWDTGVGIAAEDFERLFRPFTQLDASLARQHEGTGLGLSIAQRLTDMHGGSISIESTPGQGSRFTICLPWTAAPPFFSSNAAYTTTQAEMLAPLTPLASSSHTPHHVLVVDDNPVNLEIYAEYLRENGFAVTLAQNGQEALTVAHQEYPDLILMDIQMPGMDGMSVIRHLRADDDPALSTVPILALTALVMPGDRERCLQAGANAYWSKPFVLRDLVAEIQRLLEEKE